MQRRPLKNFTAATAVFPLNPFFFFFSFLSSSASPPRRTYVFVAVAGEHGRGGRALEADVAEGNAGGQQRVAEAGQQVQRRQGQAGEGRRARRQRDALAEDRQAAAGLRGRQRAAVARHGSLSDAHWTRKESAGERARGTGDRAGGAGGGSLVQGAEPKVGQ